LLTVYGSLRPRHRHLSGEQTKNQEVLIYFSGHGFRLINRIGDGEAYLATSDSQPDGKNAISLDRELNPLLRRSSLSNLVVMLDCCHAGALLPENRGLDRILLLILFRGNCEGRVKNRFAWELGDR